MAHKYLYVQYGPLLTTGSIIKVYLECSAKIMSLQAKLNKINILKAKVRSYFIKLMKFHANFVKLR